jgi:ribonuclease Z
VRGVSVAGVYTSIHAVELGVLLDVGIGLRSTAGIDDLFLSHGHPDHVGSLPAWLGIRCLMDRPPARVFLPAGLEQAVLQMLAGASALQRLSLPVTTVPVEPGAEIHLRNDLWVRVFRTHHVVESVGYQFFRKVQKLRSEFLDLPPKEIVFRRRRGDDLFEARERLELAYATDTLPRVLDTHPSLLDTRVLVMECSFLDERKDIQAARAGGHTHLDDLLPYAMEFRNEALVLMHFSQHYRPREVHEVLAARCPPEMSARLVPFAPDAGVWPG